MDTKQIDQHTEAIINLNNSISQFRKISDTKVKQLTDKSKHILLSSNKNSQIIIKQAFRFYKQIINKGFNLNSKVISQVWKIILHLQLRSCSFQQNTQITQNQSNKNKNAISQSQILTLTQIYEKTLIINKNQQKIKQTFKDQEQLLIQFWDVCFIYTDHKNIQYSLLYIYLSWQVLFDIQSIQNIQKYIKLLDKLIKYLIKHMERVRQSEHFTFLSKLVQQIVNKFENTFKKQLSLSLQLANKQNFHQNVYETLLICQLFFIDRSIQLLIKCKSQTNRFIHLLNRIKAYQLIQNIVSQKSTKTKINIYVSQDDFVIRIFKVFVDIWVNIGIQCNYLVNQDKSSKKIIRKPTFIQGQQIKDQNCCQQKTIRQIQLIIWQFLQIVIKDNISVILVRYLIGKLHIINLSSATKQWKLIFTIMSLMIKEYPKKLQVITFQDNISYITKKFSVSLVYPFSLQLKIKGRIIPHKQQKILLQFIDNTSKCKIIITMRNQQKDKIILSLLKFQKQIICQKQHHQFQWFQYKTNFIQILLKTQHIKLVLNSNQNQDMKIKNNLKKIDEIVLCDRQSGIGSNIQQLLQFKLIKHNLFQDDQTNQIDFISLFDPNSLSKASSLKFHKCKKTQQKSFVDFIQTLGGMDIFILALSHVLKKIKNQTEILQLIRSVLNLVDRFPIQSNITKKIIASLQMKQRKRNRILCLCWFFAKQTKSVIVILELMRFLQTKGQKNQQKLKFLCNFSYWRQFRLQHQMLLIMKIRELMKQSIKQQQKLSHLTFCKKLLFDMIILFKQSHFLMDQKQNCLKLHRMIFQSVYQQIKDILEITVKKQKLFMLQIIKFIQFLVQLVACVLNRKCHQDLFDVPFAIQLTLFLRDIAKLIFVAKQRKAISKNDFDLALEEYFKKDQKQLLLPLSLNIQQAQQERYSLYLTRIMSQTKSLIEVFEAETFYIDYGIRIYPIYQSTAMNCTQSKLSVNISNFNIYLHMLSEKSWNYLLFGMPAVQYNQKICESLWRICFYELFKEKKFLPKLSKMIEFTPLPANQYCLLKIFEAVLFSSGFDRFYLHKLLKHPVFIKNICPIKLEHLLLKYFYKLDPQVIDTQDETQQNNSQKKSVNSSFHSYQEQKIYYVLFHSQNCSYPLAKQLISCLKYRKMFQIYKGVIYNLILKQLSKFSREEIYNKKQKCQSDQSAIIYSMETLPVNKNFGNKSIDYTNFTQSSQILQEKIENRPRNQSSITQQPKKAPQNSQKQNTEHFSQLINLGLEALSFYLQSLNYANMKGFFRIQSKQDVQLLKQNFMINVQGMIKQLKNIKQSNQRNEFHKYVSFIEIHLSNFSSHLISLKFPTFKSPQVNKVNDDSIKKIRNKILYKTIHVDLIRNSTDFFFKQMDKKRIQLHSLEQVWNQIEKNNNFFWNLFINSEKYYSLSDITTSLGERLLLKISNEKPKVNLPKMISKMSVLNSLSLISDKNIAVQQSQQSSALFDDEFYKPQIQVEIKQKQRTRKGSNSYEKQIKTLKFRVLLVQNDRILQGVLSFQQRYFINFQESYINQKLYDKIGAHLKERRCDDEIEKNPTKFHLILTQDFRLLYKKYLFFDVGLEIIVNEKAYFFCFDSIKKRQKFCSYYAKQSRHKIITHDKAKKLMQQLSIRWSKGFLTNYEYLMTINQYASRSNNDLSQYLIMPWTIKEFQQKQITKSYILDENNFRDLNKPLGRINSIKWQNIKQRFQMSFGQIQNNTEEGFGIEPFLYGSFYSNPAIVTNYMIRLEPFSALHYYLQSEKIDIADRLFSQFQDQYRSITNNVSDIKQLIPEFYNNPQFLKNRSKLNLGFRQDKQMVNDVRLPKWASSPQQFAFKMKFFLQSPLVSKKLNQWIDLIFGKSAKKQNALSADNLYMSEIYGPKQITNQKQEQKKLKKKLIQPKIEVVGQVNKNSSILSLQNRIIFNKQFGQIPFILFDNLHPQFIGNEDYLQFAGNTQIIYESTDDNYGHMQKIQISFNENYAFFVSSKTMELFQIIRNQNNSKESWRSVQSLCSNSKMVDSKISAYQQFNSLSPYLFYIKKSVNKLFCRWVKKPKLFGSLEIKQQSQFIDAQLAQWIQDHILIVTHKNEFRVYNFDTTRYKCQGIQQFGFQLQEKKSTIQSKRLPPFNLHNFQIIKIGINPQLKVIVTIDSMNKIIISKYNPDKIQLINNFQIKCLYFQQTIQKLLIHKMALILILTSFNRLILYNFYNELIGSKQINFQDYNETPHCIQFFNPQSSEIIIGTNLGNIWKIDIFQFFKLDKQIHVKQLWFDKISLSKPKNQFNIKYISVKRYGRHWQIYSASICNQKLIIHKIKSLSLKNMPFNLYR